MDALILFVEILLAVACGIGLSAVAWMVMKEPP